MTESDFVPFLINDRSSAVLHLIDAFQLSESELHDIYDGVFNRMKEYFHSGDRTPNEPIKEIGIFEDESITVKQTMNGILNELKTNDEPLLFEVKPLEAYMLLAMVQAAIVSLGVPENLDKFGREFIEAFCKRYQLMFPDICKTLYLGWTTHLTEEEFDDLVDSDDDFVRVIRRGDDEMLGIPISDNFPNDYEEDFA